MNLTFILGNGFDINLGLKTSYADFYKYYTKMPSQNETLIFFKGLLDKNKENWSDFELAIPQIAEKFQTKDQFKISLIDFTNELKKYLEKETEKLFLDGYSEKISEVLCESITNLGIYSSHASNKVLRELVKNVSFLNFLTFNYTYSLEKLIEQISVLSDNDDLLNMKIFDSGLYDNHKILHVHRTIDQEILIGLDNEEQYKEINFADIASASEISYLIDKRIRNNRNSDNEELGSNMIETADLIVIFGWSMGESDKVWLEKIKILFQTFHSKTHLAFATWFEVNTDELTEDERLLREDKVKSYVVERLDLKNQPGISDRIHIILEKGFLDFDFLKDDGLVPPTDKEILALFGAD